MRLIKQFSFSVKRYFSRFYFVLKVVFVSHLFFPQVVFLLGIGNCFLSLQLVTVLSCTVCFCLFTHNLFFSTEGRRVCWYILKAIFRLSKIYFCNVKDFTSKVPSFHNVLLVKNWPQIYLVSSLLASIFILRGRKKGKWFPTAQFVNCMSAMERS